jgi:xylulokinase
MDAGRDGPLLLGLDCGTSRIKAGVYAVDGACLGYGAALVPTRREGPHRAVHDPEALWQAAAEAIRASLAPVGLAGRVVGIACASVGEASLLLDAGGKPLTAILAWYDRRGEAACEAWLGAEGEERLYAIGGQPHEPILSAFKLDWLRRNDHPAYASAASWVTLCDYVAFRLSGVLAAERSLACRSGVFSLARRDWATDLAERRGLRAELLPALRANGAPLGCILPQAAALTGLPRDCVVAVGGYDQALGALACGGYRQGTLSVTMGSTEAQVLAVEGPSASMTLCVAGVCQGMLCPGEETRRFFLSGIYTAGLAIEWLRETVFGGVAHGDLVALGAATPPGSHGVGFLPRMLVSGEAGPRSGPSGAFWGLGLGAERGALYRAVLEGLAHEGRIRTEAMASDPAGGAIDRIRAVGGDTQNPLRLGIKAAAAGLPIDVLHVRNASGLGAAMMAGLAAGVHGSVEEALARIALPVTHITPDPDLVAFHRAAMEAYRRAAALVAELGLVPSPGPVHDAG